jgi:hypothetical protein
LTLLLLLTLGRAPLLGWGTLWQLLVLSVGGAIATPICFELFGWLQRTLVHRGATQNADSQGAQDACRGSGIQMYKNEIQQEIRHPQNQPGQQGWS